MAEPARAGAPALPAPEYEFRPSTVGSGWTALYKREAPPGLDEWELVGTLQPGALRPLARALAKAIRRPLTARREKLVAGYLAAAGAGRMTDREKTALVDELTGVIRQLDTRRADEVAKRDALCRQVWGCDFADLP